LFERYHVSRSAIAAATATTTADDEQRRHFCRHFYASPSSAYSGKSNPSVLLEQKMFKFFSFLFYLT
jgi:hypothetical protein